MHEEHIKYPYGIRHYYKISVKITMGSSGYLDFNHLCLGHGRNFAILKLKRLYNNN